MGDRNITLFALHTHGDTQLGPSSVPGIGSDEMSSKGATSKAKSLFSKGQEGKDRSDEATGSKAKSLFSKGKKGGEKEETEIDASDSEEESGGGSLGTLLVGLFILAAIAMVAKKVGGGKETEVDLTESDDI